MIRLLIVDDHSIVRAGLKAQLSLDAELEIVGEAGNGIEAVELARKLKPDVIIMDLIMPGMNGIQATTIIHKELPEIEVLALTSVLENAPVMEAIEAGAVGYLLKDKQVEELVPAIKAAASGVVQLSPQVVSYLKKGSSNFGMIGAAPEFTPREVEVMNLLVNGSSNKEIANRLYLGERTIKTHVSNIMAKLGVQSRTQAVSLIVQQGILGSTRKVEL